MTALDLTAPQQAALAILIEETRASKVTLLATRPDRQNWTATEAVLRAMIRFAEAHDAAEARVAEAAEIIGDMLAADPGPKATAAYAAARAWFDEYDAALSTPSGAGENVGEG